MNMKFKAAAAASVVGALALTGVRAAAAALERRGGTAQPGRLLRSSRQANKPVIADFQETDAGKGVDVQARRTAPPATRAARSSAGPKADVVHFSLEPDVHPARRRRAGRRGLEGQRHQGHRSPVGRGLRGPQGQPQGHQDLGRPGQARRRDHHPEPGLLRLGAAGTSWPPTATCSANGGTEADAKAYLTKFFEQHRRPAGQRPRRHHRVHRAATATCCSPTRTRRSWPGRAAPTSTTSSRTSTLLIENPGAVTTDASPDGQGRSWTSSPARRRRPTTPRRASARSTAASTSEVKGANDPSDPFPTPAKLLTIDEDFGGWAEANDEVLRRGRPGIVTEDPAGDRQGVSDRASTTARHRAAAGRRARAGRPRRRARSDTARPGSGSAWR